MRAALLEDLERLSLFLGIGVIALLGLNFTLAHDLAAATRVRFLVSGGLLALVALYFRLAIREVEDLHRAAYRVATTLAIWSLAYALLPYPRTFLYLVILPAVFFALRAEVRGTAGAPNQADLLAAGLLYAIGIILYFEQQPLQVVFFSESTFDWRAYYWNAPVLGVLGVGLLRLSRWTAWRGLALLGTVFVWLAVVLTASLATPEKTLLGAPLGDGWGLPVEICYGLGLLHLILAPLFVRRLAPVADAFYAFAGLAAEDDRQRFRRVLYVPALAAMHLAIPAAFVFARGFPLALPLMLLAIGGWLYGWRWGPAVALLETALLAYPAGVFFAPELDPTWLTAALGVLITACVALRRSYRFAGLVPDWTYLSIAVLFVASLVHRGLFSPSGLLFLALLAASWAALPERPLRLPPETWHWFWPPAVAVTLLCLAGGYRTSLWSIGSLLTIAPPALSVFLLTRAPLARLIERRQWVAARNWLSTSRAALVPLSWVALAIAAVSLVLDYPAHVDGWRGSFWLFATLAVNLGLHLVAAIRRLSIPAASAVQLHLVLILALLRFKLHALETFELGSPIDGYVLLGAAFAAAGLREVLSRRTDAFSGHLLWSSSLYALLGWLYMTWLEIDGGGFHGETGSLLMAVLCYGFSLTHRRFNLVPAFVFANVAIFLLFLREELGNPQFYVTPATASVLILAQMFKQDLPVRRLQAIRLACGLAMLGTSTFYNVVDFDESVLYPLAAALLSTLMVVVGISLRVRIYLFLGFSSFVLNTLAVLVHVIRSQPPSQVKLMIGAIFLIIGVAFTGSFLLLQMKRQEILDRYAALRDELRSWE